MSICLITNTPPQFEYTIVIHTCINDLLPTEKVSELLRTEDIDSQCLIQCFSGDELIHNELRKIGDSRSGKAR